MLISFVALDVVRISEVGFIDGYLAGRVLFWEFACVWGLCTFNCAIM